ncbi:HD domain-containing phosphohydrolase [Inhella sp.]|uniref:HD domain-containing phosphohydrolase n=1 Tax=Inhella sp. TaxID=1921806 RepID=UPI0035ADB6CC
MSSHDEDDHDLLFAPESVLVPTEHPLDPWVVLIVDDEPQVHEVTELVMADFEFAGRHLLFLHAYSAAEARQVLASRSDVALILLDVVMETEHAGLDLARDIREQMRNHRSRIVLRTGQPGQAPEEHVIKNYDINDYKEKTELTKRKLNTVFFAALRSYRDILIIEQSKMALRRSIEAIQRIYDSHNLKVFASAVLDQVAHLLGYEAQGLCANRIAAYAASHMEGRLHVLAATPEYAGLLDEQGLMQLPEKVKQALDRAEREQRSHFDPHHCVGYYRTSGGSVSLLYMEFSDPVDHEAQELLEIFCSNVAITYEALLLREEVQETQRATVYILGEAVERRSNEGGAHVRRIAELAALLGQAWGLEPMEVEHLRQAAPLHDVGKIGIPDHILNKPAKLDADEWSQMQQHARIGHELLAQSDRRILRMGAQIALEHHERWDGQGYPQGLFGETISLPARIVALADVLDSLMSDRVYKKRWDFETAIDYIESQAGLHFDPRLVTLLLNRLDAVRAIYERFPDTSISAEL